ncbi:MAG: ABC transporter permease [Bacteroidota bacterium]
MNREQFDFVVKDLHRRGILLDNLGDEIIDHVCSAVEAKMNEGQRFIEAYEEVIKSFGSTEGLQQTQKETSRTIMFSNYITTALRQMSKGRLYTFINTTGLAIGIAACLLIVLYIHNELSYDAYNDKAARIYRVDTEIKFGPNHVKLASGPAPVANALQAEYPEVESTVRIRLMGSYLIRLGNETVNTREPNVAWTDSTFFKVFSVPVIEGNPAKAFTEANSVAISRSTAEKHFPNGGALGQNIILDNVKTGKITVVFEDIPSTSHFHYDVLIGLVGDWPIAKSALSQDFLTGEFTTYLLLREGAKGSDLQAKLPAFVEKYMGKAMGTALGVEFNMENFVRDGNKYEATLMPLRDIHLHSNLTGELEPNGSIVYVYMFGTIALLILLIACVNFMNLSTARSGMRAKEVGVRKAMGSLRSHLVRLFLTESTLLSLTGFAIALLMSWLLLPMFNQLASKDLSIPFGHPFFFPVILLAALTIGILAGIYPALFLSSFRPATILKGNKTTSKRSLLRNGLVVFQFTISILLIVGTITVNRQLDYIQGTRIGFDRSQIIIVKDGYALRPNPEAFKTEALKISSIERGTMSGFVPIDNPDYQRNMNATWKQGQEPSPENMVNLQFWGVDEDYIPTYGMEMIEGRNFSKQFLSDADGIIINEEAAKILSFEGGPIGKKINSFTGADATMGGVKTFTIVGVVRNFHFTSMKENIRPLAFVFDPSDNAFSFKFEADQAKATIDALEDAWKKIGPDQPFSYTFLDEEFGKMYSAEQRLGRIFELFSGLAIMIACIGLFALTAFTAEQRTKEIGIRKVLGASVPAIVILLSKEFGKLILISFVIALPVAWYGVTWWLTSYSYKTNIGLSVYALAGTIIALIAIFTMSFQSIRAALANPVKSLRSE